MKNIPGRNATFSREVYRVLRNAQEEAGLDGVYIFNDFVAEYPSVYGNGEKRQRYKDGLPPLSPGIMPEVIDHIIYTGRQLIVVKDDPNDYTEQSSLYKAKWLNAAHKLIDNPMYHVLAQAGILRRKYSRVGLRPEMVTCLLVVRTGSFPSPTKEGCHIVPIDKLGSYIRSLLDDRGTPAEGILKHLSISHRRYKGNETLWAAVMNAYSRAKDIRDWVMTHERVDVFSFTDLAYCPECGERLVFQDRYETDERRGNVRPTKQYILRHLTPSYLSPKGRRCPFEMRYSTKRSEGFTAIKQNYTTSFEDY